MEIPVGTTVTASIEALCAQSWFDAASEPTGFEKRLITVTKHPDGWFRFRGETTVALHEAAKKILR